MPPYSAASCQRIAVVLSSAETASSKALDRSPCGTGTSARLAQRYGRGLMKMGDVLVHESIIGSQFTGSIEAECEVAGIPAIIPGVAGWAITTGYNRILLDDADPYVHGFVVA